MVFCGFFWFCSLQIDSPCPFFFLISVDCYYIGNMEEQLTDSLAVGAGFLYKLSYSSLEEGYPRGVSLVLLQGFLNYNTVFSGMLMSFSDNFSNQARHFQLFF